MKTTLLTTLFALISTLCLSQTVILNPIEDNTLYEHTAGNLSNGVGDYIFAGNTLQASSADQRRALLKFDFSSIPAGATITSASLDLFCSRTIAGPTTVNLHAALENWGEGTSNAPGQEGSGATATPNDATWLCTFSNGAGGCTGAWFTPGGTFNPTSSAATVVSGAFATYTWSSATMVSDVQTWYDNPGFNFGWFVIGDETTQPTAKRFNSRENAQNPPVLTVTYTIPCNEPNITNLSAFPSLICEGNSSTITVSGSPGDATNWALYSVSCEGTLEQTQSVTDSTFLVSPTSTTTYFVQGEGGCVTTPACQSVVVQVTPLDDASFNYGAASYCTNGTNPTPTITGLGGGMFSSSPAGLVFVSTSTGEIDVAGSAVGSYTVTYTTNGSCPNSSNVSVHITAADDPSFSYSAAGYCLNDPNPTPTVTGTMSGSFSSTPAGLSLNTSTGEITTATSTVGLYTVQYSTPAGPCQDSSTVMVEIFALPPVSISPGDTAICVGDSITFTGANPGGGSVQWYLDGGLITGETNATIVAMTQGTYNQLKTNMNGCSDSASAGSFLTVNPLPPVSISPGDTAICAGESITLTGANPGGGSVQWYWDGAPLVGATGATITVTVPGTYNQLKTNSNGCSDSAAVGTTITVNALPVVILSPGDTTICSPDSIELMGAPSVNAQWYMNGTMIAGATNGSYFVSATGTYNMVETDLNGCSDSASAGIMVIVDTCTGIFDHTITQGPFIYPNPSDGVIQIMIPMGDFDEVQIMDARGRLVSRMTLIEQSTATMDVENLSAGMYMVRLTGPKGRTGVSRLIIR